MSEPKQNRAGRYMQEALKAFTDDTQPEHTVNILLQCSDKADQDFDECRTSEQKQKVWSALL